MEFEWDSRKARINVRQHDVLFEEAATVFDDFLSFTYDDEVRSHTERRYATAGHVQQRTSPCDCSHDATVMNNGDERAESPPDEVELVVTEEEYEARLKRGWADDDMLKPGRYKFKRGGFLARHPELKTREEKEV